MRVRTCPAIALATADKSLTPMSHFAAEKISAGLSGAIAGYKSLYGCGAHLRGQRFILTHTIKRFFLLV